MDTTDLNENDLQKFLASASPEERERVLVETVRSQAATLLSREDLDEEDNFLDNGLTSLTALELARTLMTLTGQEIALVAIVENPTAAKLGHHMAVEYDAAQ